MDQNTLLACKAWGHTVKTRWGQALVPAASVPALSHSHYRIYGRSRIEAIICQFMRTNDPLRLVPLSLGHQLCRYTCCHGALSMSPWLRPNSCTVPSNLVTLQDKVQRESPYSSRSWRIPFATARTQTDCSKHSSQVLVPRVRWDTCQVKLSSKMLQDVLVSPLQVRLLNLHVSPWQLPPDCVAHIWREEEKKARLWIRVTGSVFIVKLCRQSAPAAVIKKETTRSSCSITIASRTLDSASMMV